MEKTMKHGPEVAILWRGDREARQTATPESSRFHRIFEELRALGVDALPVVYDEDFADEVRDQLLTMSGVLVWVNPLQGTKTRAVLDALLRDVAMNGPWISAHPDVILKMGTKEVLFWTKHLGWGTNTFIYRSPQALSDEFPERLRTGPRVLKQNRGNDGEGVWKVERVNGSGAVRLLHARRDSVPFDLPLVEFLERCKPYFEAGGCIVDQPFQPRLPEGMIRCYMSVDKVVGFGHQLIKALVPPPPEGTTSEAARPGPRIMHPPSAEQFQALRSKMEAEWVPQMVAHLDIERRSLPVIWDADFLYGARSPFGEDSYVLCEINVSSVFPIPDQAPRAIAELVAARLREGHQV
jgi:hypothetical protein